MEVRNFSDIKSLLLDNKTIGQTIFKNTFWLMIAEVVSKLMSFFLLIYVARILGATEYGKFTFALAIIYLFGIFYEFASSRIITRDFSQEREREKEYPAILSLKIILSLGAVVLILISSFFITPDPAIRKIILILAIYIFFSGFFETIYAFLRARQQMEYESLMKITHSVLLTAFSFFVILNFPSVENLSYGYLFSTVTALILALLFFHFKIYPLSLSFDKTVWKKILVSSWPLAAVSVFSTIYYHTDSAMLGYFGQITQTGWYDAAYRIILISSIPISLISTSYYPILSQAFKESKEKFQKFWDNQMKIMISLAVPITTGGIVLAPKIIDFLYGQSYFPSVFAFQILVVTTGIIFLCITFQQGLIIANQQKNIFWAVLFGAIFNVVLNSILIPEFSLYGAAISTVVTNLLIFFLLVRFTLRFTPIAPFDLKTLTNFMITILCSLIMCLAISSPLIYSLNVILTILVGVVIYLICFFIINKIFRLKLIQT